MLAERDVKVHLPRVRLQGTLTVPTDAAGLILFAHGSGSGRHSPRNRAVAEMLHEAGLATLLLDLLTEPEQRTDEFTRHLRFDIPMLADRLVQAADWAAGQELTSTLRLGLYGASTGAAAALICAAERPQRCAAVVSRGGRPDLAGDRLVDVRAPTLLIVGGNDPEVLRLNQAAAASLSVEHQVRVVPGATHLFEEPGKLEEVAQLAREWFLRCLSD
ncbi:MAG: hydrolase [Lentisphaerae bacterium]|nr:hydrolase [Lentisphaerota bacterium]